MEISVKFVVQGFISFLSMSCGNRNDKVITEFEPPYSKAQQDYCPTNIFVAEAGVKTFSEWLLDTNHPTEPAVIRDSALYLINGRQFLIEKHFRNTNQAEKVYQESISDHNKYVEYVQSLNFSNQSHPLQLIPAREELRARFGHRESNLDVEGRKQLKV